MRRLINIAGWLLATSLGTHAQSCVMCYTAAGAQNAHARHALNAGILILLLPALTCLAALVVRIVIAGKE